MKHTIVILHGWRLLGEKYKEIQSIFEKKGFTVLAPDLPGSGTTPLTKEVMDVDDYVDFVLKFIKQIHSSSSERGNKVILIGHSFGGRIAAKLTANHPQVVEKLILTGAPLIKQPLSLKKKLIVAVAGPFKKLTNVSPLRKYFYLALGEQDYLKVPENIKETFKKIIGEDLSMYLPKISVPTLVLWGGEDTFVGKTLGKQIAQKIPNCVYKEVAGASHKLPYENPKEFAKQVLEFIS